MQHKHLHSSLLCCLVLLLPPPCFSEDLNSVLRERTQRALEQAPIRQGVPDATLSAEERRRIQEALGQTPAPGRLPDLQVRRPQGIDLNEVLRSAPKVEREAGNGPIVFVSLSMPRPSLLRLAADAQRINGALVMRGTVNGSLRQTVEAVRQLSEQGVEIQIDPQAFERYQVKVVPSVVVDLTGSAGCEAAKACADRSAVIEGDVTLRHALTYITRFSKPGKLQNRVKQWLSALEGQ